VRSGAGDIHGKVKYCAYSSVGVTENPHAALLKQKTYRRKKRLSRTTPLLGLFRPGKRPFARAAAQTIKRWRPLHISRCSLIRDSDLEEKWQTFSNSGERD
jgi:hypothetical protein